MIDQLKSPAGPKLSIGVAVTLITFMATNLAYMAWSAGVFQSRLSTVETIVDRHIDASAHPLAGNRLTQIEAEARGRVEVVNRRLDRIERQLDEILVRVQNGGGGK